MDGENVVCSGQVVGVDAAGNAFGATPRRVLHNDHHVDLLRRLRQKNGEGLRASELGPSQPWTATDFDDFEARTSSQEVLYLKNSATTIKHLLQPFQKLEKRYGRNLHGFSADIENFLQRLQGVIDFLDRENEPIRLRRLRRPPSRKCKRTRGSSETDGRSEGAPGKKSVPKDNLSSIDEPMKKRRKTDVFTDSPSTKRDLEERSGLGGAPTRAQPQSAASDPRTTAAEHVAPGVHVLLAGR